MPRTPQRIITTRIRRRPAQAALTDSQLARQWKLLERLATEPEGFTVAEAIEATGVSDKTVRRDMILLREVGFDLKETVGEHGQKSWRVRQPFERMRSKPRQYQLIRDSLDLLLVQAAKVEDRLLVDELQAMRKRIARKCR